MHGIGIPYLSVTFVNCDYWSWRASETCCTRIAENTERKKSLKIAIWAPLHNFVGLYLRN